MQRIRKAKLALPVALAVALATGATADAKKKKPPAEPAPEPAAATQAEDAEAPAEQPPPDEPAQPATTPAKPAASATVDIDALRAEYARLRDALFQSRAKAASVQSALYSTEIEVFLSYKTGRFHDVTRATIRLDGASVFDDSDGSVATSKAPRFTGYVAPGRHTLSFRLEARSKDDDRFTSVIDNTIVVVAVENKALTVSARAKDDGNIGHAWKKEKRGSYQLSLDVDVRAHKPSKGDRDQIRRK